MTDGRTPLEVVNDALAALAAELGIAIRDHALDHLTHQVWEELDFEKGLAESEGRQ